MILKRRSLSALLLAALLFLPALAENAKSSLDSAIDSLYAVRGFDQVAISPDGAHIAWVEHMKSGGNGIFVADAHAASQPPRRILTSPDSQAQDQGHIAWSPDSKRLAFLADVSSDGQLQ